MSPRFSRVGALAAACAVVVSPGLTAFPAQADDTQPAASASASADTESLLSEANGATESQQGDGLLDGDSAASFTPTYDVVADYYSALDGFAVVAPANILSDIQDAPGVKAAFVSREHEVPSDQVANGSAAANATSLAMTHADTTEQKGDGEVIAIIDSGLDVNHEAFSGDLDDSKVALSKSDVTALRSHLHAGASGTYVTEKIPFAYDYADGDDDVVPSSSVDLSHGTHVAGIAAANAGQIEGTAPGAQIMMLKVASDFSGTISDVSLLSALDDAVVLDPDVINMSLGVDAGQSSPEGTVFADVYDNIADAGIIVNVAAGNAYSSALGNTSGENLPYATDPDSSTVGEPSTYSQALSVASIDNAQGMPYISVGDRQIPYVQASGANGEDVASFSDVADGNYSYVDGGLGTFDDVSRLLDSNPDGLENSVVLVQRGGTDDYGDPMTFEQKMSTIGISLNPKAIIFYDNVDESTIPTAGISNTTTPAITVSKDDGEYMLAAADHTLTVTQGQRTAAPTNYSVSEFSSWGVTPDLKLKPEISAPGGNIYSSLPGNSYGEMSGTSMATPQMAGISALVRERVDTDSAFADYSEKQRTAVVTQLLMGTAHPLTDVDADQSGGTAYYSPRRQGAGIADAEAATTSFVYPTVDGAEDQSRPKADLGDGTSGWSFTVTLHNAGDKSASYALDTAALSEEISDGLIQEHSRNWATSGITINYSGSDVTTADGTPAVQVAAHSTANVTISIQIGQAFADYVAAHAANGTFVDGFVFFTSDDVPDLSVPFLGFYGNWGDASIFDATYWSGDAHIYGTALVNSNTGVPLGVNPLDTAATAGPDYQIDPERMVVSAASWSAAPNSMQPVTGTLRTTPSLTYEYKNSTGKVVRSYTYANAYKTLYDQSYGDIDYAEAKLGSPVFDGKSDDGQLLPQGTYTLTESATTAGPHSQTQSQTFTFEYDTTGPTITDLKTEDIAGVKTITFKVTDNTWLSAIDFHDPDSGAWFYRALATDPTVVDGNRVWSFSIPVSDLKAEWTNQGLEGDLPNTVPLYAWDYGLNSSNAATAVINEIPMTSLSASPTEASLAPGQNVSVAVTHEPADATVTDVQWSSANQSVATVSDGIITGVAPGETDITVAASGDPSVSVTIHVTVADVAESIGITLSDDSLTLATSKSSTISALLAPGLRAKNPKVEWKSSEPSVVTVEPSDDTYSAALHATDRNGDATVTATVMDGEQHYQATAQIRVRQADFADFVIDSDGTLLGYVGGSTYISIPDGVTAIADDAFRTKTMQSVHVPASVTTIGNRVFMDAPNLREVTFEDTEDHPSQLTSVGEDLISGDLKIDTIELPRSVTHLGDRVFASSTIKKVVIPEGVTEIPAGAFDSAAQLSDLTIGNTVTSFGERAFSATSELSTIKLSGSGPSVGLPAALETIGDYALSGTNISVFEFPETVRTIGTAAFAGSPARTITLNSGLESIGSSAFSSTLVQNLDVPDSVTTVGTGAFADMGELRSIRLSSHIGAGQLIRGFSRDLQLRTIEMDADADNYSLRGGVVFDRAGTHLVAYLAGMIPADRSYTVPDGVEAIEAEAFLEVKLTSVTFPDSLRSIGESAFYGSSLTSLALPDTFETLESKAFQDGALRSVDLGGTRVVGAYAFNLNTSLTDVNMRPDLGRLTEIQESAFAMDPIVSVSLPDSVVSLGDLAFANNDALRKVHIGKNLTSMDMGVFTGSNGLNELTVAEGNPVFSSDQNVLYAQRDDGLHLVLSLPTNTFTEYAVKPGTVQIDAQAFRNNTSLTKVTLPDGIKKLDVGSFNDDSSLAEINFPDSLESVDGFYNTAIKVADFGSNIVTIASDAFMFAMPQHLIVRGGNSGSFNDSMSFIDQPESAYFGEGMTSVTYDYGTLPKVLVLPASLAELSLSTWMMADTSDVEIYSAAEEGSTSWNLVADQMSANGLDPATQLKPYTALTANLVATGAALTGNTIHAVATVTGGVPGEQQVRFVEVAPDGTETVVQDWTDASALPDQASPDAEVETTPDAAPTGDATPSVDATPTTESTDGNPAATPEATSSQQIGDGLELQAQTPADAVETEQPTQYGQAIDWTVPDNGSTLRADVRDITLLTASASVGAPEPPQILANVGGNTTITEGEAIPVYSVDVAEPSDHATITYQWYVDGAAAEDATERTFSPSDLAAGTHEIHVVVQAALDGLFAQTTSSNAYLTILAKAEVPEITGDLPQSAKYTVGDTPTALVVAATTKVGTLSYQWYANGTAIDGAVGPSYVPSATAAGTTEYWVVVTSTNGTSTASVRSATTTITVVSAESNPEQPGGSGAGSQPTGEDTADNSSPLYPVVSEGNAGGEGSAGGNTGGAQSLPDTGMSATTGLLAAALAATLLGLAAISRKRTHF